MPDAGPSPKLPARLTIAYRFRGPPRSGNGGYVCGRLAEFVGGDCRVRLMRPPPLERELEVVPDDGGVILRDGDHIVARARPATVEVRPRPAVPVEEARRRSRNYRGFHSHAFGSCFVCGPERAPGDGLRIFPGAATDGADRDGVVACTWIPDPALASADGTVPVRYVWAALDCPSGWAWLHPGGRVAVLGEFAVHIERDVPAGEELMLAGWPVADQGRKHRCGSALYAADGSVLARAEATWIDVDTEAPGN